MATTPSSPSPDAAWPAFDASTLDELAGFGTEHEVTAGEFVFTAGDTDPDFIVILEGEVEIIDVDPDDGKEVVVVATHGAGKFLGELNMLTGQRAYLSARVRQPGRIIRIAPPEFRRLMGTKPDISDVIFRAFAIRRDVLRTGPGANAIRIIGSTYSADALELRAYANRNRIPHTWIDVEALPDAVAFLGGLGATLDQVPLVITPTGRLSRPTPGELAEQLGLTYRAVPGWVADLIVVGAGPAGLAAAVYGASEGLDTVCLDTRAPGGQAGASSRIENYMGFPNGISGEDLTGRAAIQAMRLGARLNAPCQVSALHVHDGFHVVTLADGSEIPTRSVIVASGARYRRLDVDDLARFEGAGVYYAATELEARTCRDEPVVVVGGGNSAGQAAIYLAQQGSRVSLMIRRDDLAATMSRYLIARIEADPRIELLTQTEVRALDGESHLQALTFEHTATGEHRTTDCTGLFCFIGAVPATDWLEDCAALDRSGFVLTDRSLTDGDLTAAFVARDPLPYESSLPGVFAVGDVRAGSMKRVAAAVGEGSSAVRSVHSYLALHG